MFPETISIHKIFGKQFHSSVWKIWSKYVFICFLLILILWKSVNHHSLFTFLVSLLTNVFIVISFIGSRVLVYAVSPCWLNSLFVFDTFFSSFPQPTIFIRRRWKSKVCVLQFSILFKIMTNILVPFWLASSWYFLKVIYYNSKISFLSSSSYFTFHHYELAGFFFLMLYFNDAEFCLPFIHFFWV